MAKSGKSVGGRGVQKFDGTANKGTKVQVYRSTDRKPTVMKKGK